MTVHDLWEGMSRAQVAENRQRNLDRYQRRWRDGTRLPSGRLKQFKQGYKEHERARAFLDDAAQMGRPGARAISAGSVTVDTLLDRHLATKTDRAPGTIEADRHHANHVRQAFGDRVVSTLTPTEIEVWSVTRGISAESRKKRVELLRASIRRGMRDRLVDYDPTEGIVVSLGHKERPAYSSQQLMAILEAARDNFDRTLLAILGLMGARGGEARSLRVGDYRNGSLSILNGGSGTDTTKTRASRRVLPVPGVLVPWLDELVEGRSPSEWMFPSSRTEGAHVAKQYANQALTRAVARANEGRDEPIPRYTGHALRHTFAGISLSEAGADLLAVSRAMGHARPSITLDRYGHLAPAGLGPLMSKIDALVAPQSKTA